MQDTRYSFINLGMYKSVIRRRLNLDKDLMYISKIVGCRRWDVSPLLNTTSEYKYDGVGKRIEARENGQITKYLYDGLNVIIERDGNDNTVTSYVRGLSYGGGIGGIISRTTQDSGRTTYYHYDGLGSVTGLTDITGKTVQTYTYDAYGNLLASQGQEANSYQFSTKEYDSTSELTYFGVRYYNAKTGRWITKDPLFQSIEVNLYRYVNNNPINLIDLWGFRPKMSEEEILDDLDRLRAKLATTGLTDEEMARLRHDLTLIDDAIEHVPLWEDPGFMISLGGAGLIQAGKPLRAFIRIGKHEIPGWKPRFPVWHINIGSYHIPINPLYWFK